MAKEKETAVESGPSEVVVIGYTNHKGEFALRRVLPIKLLFGLSKYHKGHQWFLRAFDYGRSAERNFAMRDISSWTAEGEESNEKKDSK